MLFILGYSIVLDVGLCLGARELIRFEICGLDLVMLKKNLRFFDIV